jgi:hypothetical protein
MFMDVSAAARSASLCEFIFAKPRPGLPAHQQATSYSPGHQVRVT